MLPLTPRGKFRIFRQNVTDPLTFVGTAIQAGIGQATNEFPSYGQGAAGYAKRYCASVADFAIGEFISTFAFPTLLHEDPRYVSGKEPSLWVIGGQEFDDAEPVLLIQPVRLDIVFVLRSQDRQISFFRNFSSKLAIHRRYRCPQNIDVQ